MAEEVVVETKKRFGWYINVTLGELSTSFTVEQDTTTFKAIIGQAMGLAEGLIMLNDVRVINDDPGYYGRPNFGISFHIIGSTKPVILAMVNLRHTEIYD